MKTKLEIIETIHTDFANLEQIAKTGSISGCLLEEIERAMQEYANQKYMNNDYAVKERQWIDAKEYSPMMGYSYLIFVKDVGIQLDKCVSNGRHSSYWYHHSVYVVTHFMPLPSPPTIKPIKL